LKLAEYLRALRQLRDDIAGDGMRGVLEFRNVISRCVPVIAAPANQHRRQSAYQHCSHANSARQIAEPKSSRQAHAAFVREFFFERFFEFRG
jgi:hypothetical protein